MQAVEQKKEQQPAATMTEAAFSLNVKLIDKFGQEVMLTFRCSLANQAQQLLGHYENVVGHLIKNGWQTLKAGARYNPPDVIPVTDTPSTATPSCRIHGTPMKPSRKPGSFFCSKKNADGAFCQEKA